MGNIQCANESEHAQEICYFCRLKHEESLNNDQENQKLKIIDNISVIHENGQSKILNESIEKTMFEENIPEEFNSKDLQESLKKYENIKTLKPNVDAIDKSIPNKIQIKINTQ